MYELILWTCKDCVQTYVIYYGSSSVAFSFCLYYYTSLLCNTASLKTKFFLCWIDKQNISRGQIQFQATFGYGFQLLDAWNVNRRFRY
jgi:hypothetical protein